MTESTTKSTKADFPQQIQATSSSTENSQSIPSQTKQQKSIYETVMSSPDSTRATGGYENKNDFYYSPRQALHRPITPAPPSNIADPSNEKSLQNLTRKSLPYFQPWFATAGPAELPPDFSWLSNSCGGKAAIGVFGGGIMGLLMGVFLGAMSDATPPVTIINGKEVPQAPLKEQFKITMRATADKSLYWCRNFAFLTGIFTGSECLVEKYRGKKDVWNPVMSGCITGAALQAKQGPQAAAIGCGGFAAFSLVIDSFMGHY